MAFNHMQICMLCMLLKVSGVALCPIKIVPLNYPQLFSMNSESLPTRARQILVYSSQERESCNLDTSRIFDSFNFPNNTMVIGVFAIVCSENMQIFLNISDNHMDFSNIISYVNLYRCMFDVENMDTFLKITNTRVLLLHSIKPELSENKIQSHSCVGFRNIVSLTILSMKENEMGFMKLLFNCTEHTSDVRELQLQNCDGVVYHGVLEDLFHQLQGFEIQNCVFNGTLRFPWSVNGTKLPDNLERSDYMQNQYGDSLHLNIPANIFRKQVSFNLNGIERLDQIQLNGSLHYLKISNNVIHIIHRKFLQNVYGLQVIILTANGIRNIVKDCLSEQTELTYLDLSLNLLEDLPALLFDNLKKLQFLNLGNNRLKSLPCNLFFNLNELRTLYLDNNQLSVLESILPIHSIKFKYLNLNSNPLQSLPVSILYIRSIQRVEVRYTNISFSRFTDFLKEIDANSLGRSVTPSGSSLESNIFETTENWRQIDLTGSNVTGFIMSEHICPCLRSVLLMIMKHFQFILEENPLTCFSDIIPFNKVMLNFTEEGQWNGMEYFFVEWLCTYPEDLSGKPVLRIKAEDTYQRIFDEKCPFKCECYFREFYNVSIVNCRKIGISTIPETAPSGRIDIWLEHNNISVLNFREYLTNVRELRMSYNVLTEIELGIFHKMKSLTVLKLDNNFLVHIPRDLEHLKLHGLCLDNNPLACDCKALWLKTWLLKNSKIVKNMKHIGCFSEDEEKTYSFVTVPDSDFVCREQSIYKHYAIPVISASISVFILVLTIFIVYIYRQEVKVLIYMTCELHPFDRGKQDETEVVDITIVHTRDSIDFVEAKLLNPLQGKNFVVCSTARDFVAGYSLRDNIVSAVRSSKHVLIVLSNGLVSEKNFLDMVWTECQQKLRKRSNFLLVTNTLLNSSLSGLREEFRKYLKVHQHLKPNGTLFFSKVVYILSCYQNARKDDRHATEMNNMHRMLLYPLEIPQIPNEKCDILFCFSNDEHNPREISLLQSLENEGYRVNTPDSDFNPGKNVLTNIGESVHGAMHTVLLICSRMSDIQSLIFQIAVEKTRSCKYNHLIVIFRDKNNLRMEDGEIQEYCDNFVCLDLEDEHFYQRLKFALLPPVSLDLNDIEFP